MVWFSITAAQPLYLGLAAKGEESSPRLRVKTEDPKVEVKALDFEVKTRSRGGYRVAFRFMLTNTGTDGSKNGQLFFKAFDKDGFELVDPGRIFESHTVLHAKQPRKAISEQLFDTGEWERVQDVELYWKSLKFLDK
jgi:hypothetical protein